MNSELAQDPDVGFELRFEKRDSYATEFMQRNFQPIVRHVLFVALVLSLLLTSPAIAENGDESPEGQGAELGGLSNSAHGGSLLSPADKKILALGKVSSGKVAGSMLLAATIGFGSGHALLGSVGDGGWKFTLGEVASLLLMANGLGRAIIRQDGDGNGGTIFGAGLIGFGVFRAWELVDVIVVSEKHNMRHKAAYDRSVGTPSSPPVSFFVTPRGGGNSGVMGGLALSF